MLLVVYVVKVTKKKNTSLVWLLCRILFVRYLRLESYNESSCTAKLRHLVVKTSQWRLAYAIYCTVWEMVGKDKHIFTNISYVYDTWVTYYYLQENTMLMTKSVKWYSELWIRTLTKNMQFRVNISGPITDQNYSHILCFTLTIFNNLKQLLHRPHVSEKCCMRRPLILRKQTWKQV